MSKIFLKRINKEISFLNDKNNFNNYSNIIQKFFYNIFVNITIVSDNNYNLEIIKDDKIFLELRIPEQYPFIPYNIVSYNIKPKFASLFNYNLFNYKSNVNYYKHLNNIYTLIQNRNKEIYKFFFYNLYEYDPKFLNLDKTSCYCCSTILCPSLWTPSLTVKDIILEHIEIEFIEKYSSCLMYNYLYQIYQNLLFDSNSLFSKLPNEIIEKIFRLKLN